MWVFRVGIGAQQGRGGLRREIKGLCFHVSKHLSKPYKWKRAFSPLSSLSSGFTSFPLLLLCAQLRRLSSITGGSLCFYNKRVDCLPEVIQGS